MGALRARGGERRVNWRRLLVFAHDVTAAAFAWALAFWLRFNLDVPLRR